ncbi:cytochrome b [Thioclava kandeliae]|uniref:Cytochrome b/b6 domain-containing protein n=1 Tax=Thioclava kandeliae TaxID=3070818 RepID=A0ABV1SH20_9RHOB
MARRTGYSGIQILLHWAVAVLVVFNWFYSEGMGRAVDNRLDGSTGPLELNPQIHVWVGVAVLVLVVVRFGLRKARGGPDVPGQGLLHVAGVWGHRLLYVLLFAVPLLGMAMWFAGIDAAGDIHKLCADALLILAGAHAAMGLFHHYVLKDGLMARMMRPES